MDVSLQRLSELAALSREEIGRSEENVKQKFVVPLLEALNHGRNQLDFEYGSGSRRIDIFVKDLPPDCKLIIDTKNYDEDLSNHLEQIGLYAFQEGALLSLLINGEEIRIYDAFFRGFSFKDSLLYSFKRSELTDERVYVPLMNLLSRDSLISKKTKDFIINREKEIIELYDTVATIKKDFADKRSELNAKREAMYKDLDNLQTQIRTITEQSDGLDAQMSEKIGEYLQLADLPYMRETKQEISPSYVQEIRTRNVISKSVDKMEIVLNNIHSHKTYNLILLPKDYRSLFPGYKVPFYFETDIGTIQSQVTSGPKGTRIGDPEAGSYINGGLQPWYAKHKDLQEGDKLVIEVIEQKKRYRLTLFKQAHI